MRDYTYFRACHQMQFFSREKSYLIVDIKDENRILMYRLWFALQGAIIVLKKDAFCRITDFDKEEFEQYPTEYYLTPDDRFYLYYPIKNREEGLLWLEGCGDGGFEMSSDFKWDNLPSERRGKIIKEG